MPKQWKLITLFMILCWFAVIIAFYAVKHQVERDSVKIEAVS